MQNESTPVRYSCITGKNPREILMLRGSGCRWRRCRFCDYHLDYSNDEKANYQLNQAELKKVTGKYQVLEVINSGSFTDLDEATMNLIIQTCLIKKIHTLHFETHWIHRDTIAKWKKELKELGIDLKIKMGVETFDGSFREEVLDKGMEYALPEEIAQYADEVCLLFGLEGQTEATMRNDIETGLALFERICINIMVENTTRIKPCKKVIALFQERLYPLYKDNQRADILLNNTDFGVGGENHE